MNSLETFSSLSNATHPAMSQAVSFRLVFSWRFRFTFRCLSTGNRDETVKNLLLLQGVALSGSARLEIKNIADATVEKMEEFDPETKR